MQKQLKIILFFLAFFLYAPHMYASILQADVTSDSVTSYINPLNTALKQDVPSFQPATSFNITLVYTPEDFSSDRSALVNSIASRFPISTLKFIPNQTFCIPNHEGGYHVVLIPENIMTFYEINAYLNNVLTSHDLAAHSLQSNEITLAPNKPVQRKYFPVVGFIPHISLGTLPSSATQSDFDALLKASSKFIFENLHAAGHDIIKFSHYS